MKPCAEAAWLMSVTSTNGEPRSRDELETTPSLSGHRSNRGGRDECLDVRRVIPLIWRPPRSTDEPGRLVPTTPGPGQEAVQPRFAPPYVAQGQRPAYAELGHLRQVELGAGQRVP